MFQAEGGVAFVINSLDVDATTAPSVGDNDKQTQQIRGV